MFVRLTRGRFAIDQYDVMVERLRDAESVLVPAVRELPGLIDYYAGIDRDSGTMIRVSVWDSSEHAEAIATFPAIVSAKALFESFGVEWEPSVTYDVAWWVQPA
jgi:quinol monooxygenase YgiN